jgi:hypothetical protein
MQEQIWARCRSNQCASDVKLMLTSVSRPSSALNRLASFLQWPLSDIPDRMSPKTLAENGFILQEGCELFNYYNPTCNIPYLSTVSDSQ